MAPVYSIPFIHQRGLVGLGDLVVVPAGHVYVVKQLAIWCNPEIDTPTVFFELQGTGQALFGSPFDIEHSGWVGFYGALAFLEGDAFQFNVRNAPVDGQADVYAGGYDLASG